MDLTLRLHVLVPAPVEETWRYVAQEYLAHHGRWDPAVTGMRLTTTGPLRTGSRGQETRSFAGTQVAEFEVTAMDRPTTFALRNTSGPFHLERSYRFLDAGSSTELTFTFQMRPRGAMRPCSRWCAA